ncbi:MAG TPA: alpha/beta hydrolase [Burkholderiales bacterium]|nr:alpha/beta hydrolase [Burkholderiales bacterium]
MSDPAFLSREYNNRELFPDHPRHFARWQESSARARGTMICYLDRAYGNAPGETLDIFPARKGDGSVLVFIHGGYWRSLDKKDFSFLAPAWVDAGVSLVVVNYGLAPVVTVERIVQQMLAASAWVYRHAEEYGMDEERLFVSGHSAGGHLAAMMLAALWQVYERSLPKDLYKGALAVSGVYDLRPLVQVDWLQGDLRLDEATALKLSPAFLPPATRAPLTLAVGGLESSEFKRQNALLAQRWKSVLARDVPMPGRDHFTVIDGLADRANPLFAATRRMMGLDQ